MGLLFLTRLKDTKLAFYFIILANLLEDVLFGLFIIVGIENGPALGNVSHYHFNIPWSHSFFMVIVWSLMYGVILFQYSITKKYARSDAQMLFKLTTISIRSHWILDLVVHGSDMQYHPFTTRALPTIHLWSTPWLAFLIELIFIIACWFPYQRQMRKRNLDKNSYLILVLILVAHTNYFGPSFYTNFQLVETSLIFGILTFTGLPFLIYLMLIIHSLP